MQGGASEVRRGTSSIHFHCLVPGRPVISVPDFVFCSWPTAGSGQMRLSTGWTGHVQGTDATNMRMIPSEVPDVYACVLQASALHGGEKKTNEHKTHEHVSDGPCGTIVLGKNPTSARNTSQGQRDKLAIFLWN